MANSGRRRLRRRALLGTTLLATGAALVFFFRAPPFGRPPLVEPGAAAGYNVLLVTLDTTRPDYLTPYGGDPSTTPALASLLSSGICFDHAYTSAPLTLPAHASILTGLDPPNHGVRNNGTYILGEEATTLAEALAVEGYDTAAFVSCFVLDSRFGLDQGFREYDFQVTDRGRQGPQSLENERDAENVTAAALRWLDGRSSTSPFFLWVHYFDPHAPYAPPPTRARPRVPEDPDKAYEAEIAFVDLYFGELLRMLANLGVRERTIVFVVSDHGESLGEHGEDEHGVFLYDATMRIALILSCPALIDSPQRVGDRVVGAVDVFPTILDLLGIETPLALDGESLLTPGGSRNRAIYMESLFPRENLACAPLYGLRRLDDKLILAPKPEYYELAGDPGEASNRWSEERAEVRELQSSLEPRIGTGGERSRRTMSLDERSRLESLGYLQAGSGSGEERDPKDQVPVIKRLKQVLELKRKGEYEKAIVIAREVTEEAGAVDATVMLIAELLSASGAREEAIVELEAFLEEHESLDVTITLARLHLEEGRTERVLELLSRVESEDPGRGLVPLLRGDAWAREGRYEDAVREYRRASRIDGERVGPLAEMKIRETQSKAEGARR